MQGVEPIQTKSIKEVCATAFLGRGRALVGGYGIIDGKVSCANGVDQGNVPSFTFVSNPVTLPNGQKLPAGTYVNEGFMGLGNTCRIVQDGKYSIMVDKAFYVGAAIQYAMHKSFRDNLSGMVVGNLLCGIELYMSKSRKYELRLEGKNVDILLHRGKFDFIVEGNVIKTCLTMREAENYVLGK